MIENWTTPHEFTAQEKNLYNSIIGLASQALASYQLRQAQMEAEQRFRTLVENAPEAIVVFSGETGLFMEANQNAADLYGYDTPEELFGKHPGSDLSPEFQPDGRTSMEAAGGYIMEAIEGGTPVFDWMHITSQGKEIPCEIRLVRLPGGDIPIIRGSVTDITARKTAQDTIVQGDRLKSEFLANMSHELRTPLNSIVGYTDVLLMGIDGEVNDEMRIDLEAIQENSQTLLRIINDILDLAKIEAGRVIFELSEIDVKTLLEDVVRNNAGLLVNKPVEMLLEVKNKLPKITVDAGRVEQILNNLVSNAVKFTKKGEITIEALTEDDWMVMKVKDTGIGIHEKDLQVIFDEFRQADGSHTRTAEGTGLGLNITRHLVQLHGGIIEVESEMGVGSTFIVRLPLVTRISPEITVKISEKANGDTGGLQKPKEKKKSTISKRKLETSAQEKENGKKVEAKIADFTKELKHVMPASEPDKRDGKGNSKK